MNNRTKRYTDEQIINAVRNANSIADVMRILKIKYAGGSHANMSKRIKKLNLDTSHFYTRPPESPVNKLDWEKVLIKNRIQRRESGYKLRRALIESGRDYKCFKCDIYEWQGEILILQVHHLNRDTFDNRPENLEFICPNCHSQEHGTNGKKHEQLVTKSAYTKNKIWKTDICDCGKLKSPKAKLCEMCRKQVVSVHLPTKEELITILRDRKSFLQAGKYYGVSDNAVRKWCVKYNIPCHKPELKIFLKRTA